MMQQQISTAEIGERVKRAVARTFGLEPDEVTESTTHATVPGWDSIGQLDLVLALEEEFGMAFTPEDILLMNGVEAIRALLEARGITPLQR